MEELDERPICIAGTIRLESGEKVELNVVLKFNKGTLPESLYQAIAGKNYGEGIGFFARVHDNCEGDK